MFTPLQQEELARLHYPLVESAFYTLFPSFERYRDDFLSDGALGLLTGLRKWEEGTGNLRSFLYTCICNRMRDRARKINARPDTFAHVPEDTPVDSPEIGIDNRDYLNTLLRKLSPERLEVIEMKYWGGYTLKEIAQRQRILYKTLVARHRTSLEHLRQFPHTL